MYTGVGPVDSLNDVDDPRGERATIALHARWRALLTATPDLLFWLSADGVYLDWHATRPELLAADPTVFLGRPIEEVLEPEAARRCRAAIERAIANGGVETVEYDLELPVGRRSFEARVFAVGDEVTVIVRDATSEVESRRALVDQAVFLEAMLTGAFDMVVVVDARGSISYASRSVHDVLGHRVADLIGTHLLDWVHPDDLAAAVESLANVLTQPGAAGPRELRIRDASGGWRMCETVANNLLHESAVKGIVYHGRDISERRGVSALLRAAFEQNPEASLIVRDGGSLVASVAFSRLVGRTIDELEKMEWNDLAPGRDLADAREHRLESVRLGCRDGTELIADLLVVELPDDEAGRSAATFVVIDHIHGHQVEDATIALGDAIDWASDLVVYIGANGFWTANRTAVEHLGYPKGIQAEMLELVHPADRLMVATMFDRVVRGDWDSQQSVAVRLLTATGATRHYECRARRVPHLSGAVVVARDVTDAATHVPLRSDITPDDHLAAVAQLAVGAAHDFSNLLGVASNYLYMLERSQLDEAQRSDSAAARRAIDEAGLLVSRLLAIGRPSGPDARSDAAEVVAAHYELLESSVPSAILFAVDVAAPVPVPVDAQDVLQIVLNLVSNAVDAIGAASPASPFGAAGVVSDSGRILVRGGVDADGRSWIAVSDTGSGMDAVTIAAAITPFFTTKARGVGTGLGLSLVSSVVRTSGGALDVESELGDGTTITLSWPQPTPVGPSGIVGQIG